MLIKASALRRIIKEEAGRILHEDAGAAGQGLSTPTQTTSKEAVLTQVAVLKSLTDTQVAVSKIPDVKNSGTSWVKECNTAIDSAVKNFTKMKNDKNFAKAVFESIGPNEANTGQALLAALASMSTAASQTLPGQFKQVLFGAQFNTDMEKRFFEAINSINAVNFIVAIKKWCQEVKIAPVAPAPTSPKPPAPPTTPPVTPAPPKPAAPPVQDWAGYIAKTPNGGDAVKAAWEANSKVTGQSPGFAAFVAWWHGMQKTRGQSWRGDPADVTAQLNADTKLKTPEAAPSGPAGVPGQAVAAESLRRSDNLLNETGRNLLQTNLKIIWGK